MYLLFDALSDSESGLTDVDSKRHFGSGSGSGS